MISVKNNLSICIFMALWIWIFCSDRNEKQKTIETSWNLRKNAGGLINGGTSFQSYLYRKQAHRIKFSKATLFVVSGPRIFFFNFLSASQAEKVWESLVLIVFEKFSNFAWAEPLKNKISKSILNAFAKILNRGGLKTFLYTNRGLEFAKKFIQSCLK